jgi:hypothetical protein
MSRKAIQGRLPFPDPLVMNCAAGRDEPTVWVQRVVLWHDIADAPVRDVKLRRGLNIVWSPVGDGPEGFATGHAAGKSLFCRLVRYCLGEDSFAAPDDTASIRALFPNGAVGAEIRIKGNTWVVRRRFALPRNDRATRTECLEKLVDEESAAGFEEFLNVLEQAVFDSDQVNLLCDLPEVRQPWQFLLAWLSRDQECRIAGLTHWRHPESSSYSPARNASADTRLQVLRVVLGLYSKRAHVLRKNAAEAASRAKTAESARRGIETRCLSLQEEIAASLEIAMERVWPPPVDLLQDEGMAREAHFRSLLALADQRIRSVAVVHNDSDHARDVEELSQVAGRLARLDELVSSLGERVAHERERVNLLDDNNAKRWSDYREAKHPVCPYDDTALDVEASKFKCPLARLPDPAMAKRTADGAAEALQTAREGLAHYELELQSCRDESASLKVKFDALNRRVGVSDATAASQTSASQAAWAAKGLVRRLFELHTQLDAAIRAECAAKEELKTCQAEQIGALSDYSTAKLQRWFDFLVRRIVAPEATGTIVLDGNGLHPRIQWRGPRRSVALDSLQIVLFDMAAMLCSVEGDSSAPAFLVHDSPREGDLDPWTYGRIFEAILELGPDESSAPFQYIITTTTEPPDGRARARVRLEIGADEARRRFFQADL